MAQSLQVPGARHRALRPVRRPNALGGGYGRQVIYQGATISLPAKALGDFGAPLRVLPKR